ncbi:adenine phosphoribosyltransferase [Virgibacillus sp. AGTR]|uniref:phosphoribosyltransferase family protein n=1 Tax=Virgibacillus TaxID=84406 RepID=UPI001965FF90|nr:MULTISPECIES: phosphoribosyltransferase family protein [Virgibacillus]MCC2252318.1 adenine phosphoribosyltransferase [Virgibacillus sp. AGTR]MDY7046203.1 phosphoribosyltransferase family protein [Virgibacillus sp. M23]QRZ19501.1 adenine phosphoribosyltransferase [Virgibacillus sp. AGTR]WBX80822.1 phosphoribosyltransferase family protein [Virgibacillus salarius]
MNTYPLKVAGITRDLPIIPINDEVKIASFVVLGDTELISATAPLLAEKLPEVDILVTAEAKGIPFIHELSKHLEMDRYIVVRKSVKPYMEDVLIHEVNSITTQKQQLLCLDKHDVARIKGKRVALIDDVISTGESMMALESLVADAGGHVTAKAAILAEGDAANRDDIIFLEKLPLFK